MRGNFMVRCFLQRRGQSLAILVSVGLILFPFKATAALWDPFSGKIDLSAIQAQVDNLEQETLRQEYNVNFQQKLSPWVDFRLAMRYYKFDQELELLLGGYRKEIQPSGEIRWSHPLFHFSTSAFRRELTTSGNGLIITKDFQSSVRTTNEGYPLVELRYDRQHTFSPEVDESRDIKNSRVQARADYSIPNHDFNYSFSHILSQNVITDLSSQTNRHLFRWSGSGRGFAGGRLNLSGNYSFNYATQTNEVDSGDTVLELAPIAVGLYALDFDPDLGSLNPRPGLADGNKVDPVIPVIDIGGGNAGHNLGADLGFGQRIAGMYIFTDRPSGDQIRWDVYGSFDNISWQRLISSSQFFNPALNRYEISCSPADYRFVKAVNIGVNEIALVQITEIEVLRELPADADKQKIASSSNTFDGRAAYRINDRWEASLDGSLQADENIGQRGDRNRWALGGRLFFDQSPKVAHHFRIDLSREGGQSPRPILMDSGVGYTMLLDPLETLRGSLSLSNRQNHLNGSRSQNILSGAGEANATILPDLDLSIGSGVSRIDEFIVVREFQSWYVRGGINAQVLQSLDFSLDYNYRETEDLTLSFIRIQRNTNLAIDWQVTKDIYARAILRSTRRLTRVWTQDFLVSWIVLPNVRVSGQYYEVLEDDRSVTGRKSVFLNWDLSSKSTVYLRLAELDYSGSGGSRTVSFQQGFRMTF